MVQMSPKGCRIAGVGLSWKEAGRTGEKAQKLGWLDGDSDQAAVEVAGPKVDRPWE